MRFATSFAPRKTAAAFALVIAFFLSALPAAADKIRMKDGADFEAELLRESGSDMRLRVEGNIQIVPKAMIDKITYDIAELEDNKGQRHKGRIVKETDVMVTILYRRGSMSAELTFNKDLLFEFNRKTITEPPKVWKDPPRPHTKFEKLLEKGGEIPEPTEKRSEKALEKLYKKAMRFYDKKDFERTEHFLRIILRTKPDNLDVLYFLACMFGAQGNAERAEGYLRWAVLAGFGDLDRITLETDLADVRKRKFYKDLMKNRNEVEDLVAQRMLDGLKKKFGDKYVFQIDEKRKLIIGTYHSLRTLMKMQAHISRFADAQWKGTFKNKPSYYITILMPTKEDFDRLTRERGMSHALAWYSIMERMLICTGIDLTLDHEFTHALHHVDQIAKNQFHPIWVIEGLATLFEHSVPHDGKMVPEKISYRLIQLQGMMKMGTPISIKQMTSLTPQDFVASGGPMGSLHYAEARFLMVYMWEKGLFGKFYNNLLETYKEDYNGLKALEKTFGKGIDDISKEWKEWILKLEIDLPMPQAGRAWIGADPVQLPDDGGVILTRIAIGGPADEAGILHGDLLLEFNGMGISAKSTFFKKLHAKKPGDEVTIKVKRGSKELEFKFKLGSEPQRFGG
ncbi:MAG: tetratricopeptide repeat protein [Planctomycetota bacterium]|jgi:hypothetical protein